MREYRGERPRGLILPNGINGVLRQWDKLRAGLFAGGPHPKRAIGRVKPGIEADLPAFDVLAGKPVRRVGVGQRTKGKSGFIHLLRRLKGVAAVDKDGGPILEDDRNAGRAGESGQPGQPARPFGDILPLMLVGQWNDEAVDFLTGQVAAQRGQPLRRLAAGCRGLGPRVFVEGRPEMRAQLFRRALGDHRHPRLRVPHAAVVAGRGGDPGNQRRQFVGGDPRLGCLEQLADVL